MKFNLKFKGVLLLFTISTLINCNPFAKKEENNNSLLAGLLVVAGGQSTISPTAGEDVCDGKIAIGSPTIKSGTISSSETWSNSIKLSGTVNVASGAVITIAPGTVIFGETGSSLFFLQGSKINAIGTASSPICFTSAKTVGARAPGDWGGVVIIGNAIGTRSSTTEGTTPQNYGSGTDDSDSSGSLKYVIIEFAGNEVSAGDELNGLSSYTVGSGTTYDYVQVHRGLDDGFEFWGGKVNGTHLVVTGTMDDDYDLDEGYRGTLQYLIGVKYPSACGGTFSSDPHGMEMDGVHSGGTCSTKSIGCTAPTVSNYVVIGQQITGGRAQRHREGLAGSFSEGISYNFATGVTCDASTGFPATTSSFTKVISDKDLTNSSSCTGTVSNTVTSLPITSLGAIDATNCGNGVNKPDFNTVSTYSASAAGPVDPSAANWWANWTVYRSK